MNQMVLVFMLVLGIPQAIWSFPQMSDRMGYSVQSEINNTYSETSERGSDASSPTEQELHKYKLFLILLGISIIGLFGIMLFIHYFRARRYRFRKLKIGQKAEPTEYIDAWSQHRINDEER